MGWGWGAVATARGFTFCLCATYLVAFASVFAQVPGLFGPDGLLPISTAYRLPVLLRRFHRAPDLGLEALCLAGVGLSGLGVVWARFRSVPFLAGLWWLYRSIYLVGGE